ncbi:phosphoglycolate phosphatase [Shimia sp.]|uniref:phosphoglycolate phosphatase n=1 Tax=Shimia sp. TaxID=1954381 RepID=UPI0032986611
MSVVIFDLDGTLVDSIGDIHVAVNRMLTEEGVVPLSMKEVMSFVGNGLPKLVHRVIEAREMDKTEFQRIHDIVLDLYTNTPISLTKPYPGVIRALDDLQAQGMRLGVCTNKPHAPAMHILQALDLQKYFEVIVGGDSLADRKPHPMPLQHVVDELGGGDVLYVGDSEVDADTAVNAGLKFALFTEGYRKSPIGDIPHQFAFSDYSTLAQITRDAFVCTA